jgi:hypothetical protein
VQDRRIIGLCLAILSIALVVGCLHWSVQALPDHGNDMQDNLFPGEPPDDFFAGEYAIVGQKPADGVAYKGRARIEIRDHKIHLSRTIYGRTTTVAGTFYPGGESKKKSLQFNWKDSRGNAEMFCQYSVDFDNYARLSCSWSYGRDSLPGFESYYPVAGLSKERRGKASSK